MSDRVLPTACLLLISLSTMCDLPAQLAAPAPGISQELAESRAKTISRVRYGLSFRLEKGMKEVHGTLQAQFELKGKQQSPVVLDFAGESVGRMLLNGKRAAEIRTVRNHLILPAAALRPGENDFRATFSSKVAPTGTPLTVYRDQSRGEEYLYTLVVPADAHRLFPCFDQPDLKAAYSLTIEAPSDWVVVANGSPAGELVDSERSTKVWSFEATKPLSTYLFAFAAGPFHVLEASEPLQVGDSKQTLRMFLRRSKLEQAETRELFDMHRKAVSWLGDYFQEPYPFGKLDMVLVPGFPYGGMEHAGAIFYRESALVFDHEPTQGELTRRSTLIYHEVSHQWFGNLVTMRWFDDLWLKEGFATFVGYTLFEILEPGKKAWLRFHQRVKPRAYQVDATRGTTPVYQKLENLANAKSAYGAIVYNKAPAVIRELNARLGPRTFRKGLQLFVSKHRFANATWQDLVSSLEEAASTSSAHWSDRWILAAGMPRVRVDLEIDGDGKTKSFVVRQESVQGGGGAWPLQLEMLILDADGEARPRMKVILEGAEQRVPELEGKIAPACVVLNPRDVAYGQFLLDPRSRDYLVGQVHEIEDLLLRAVAMSALFETLRQCELDPIRYVEAALLLLEKEMDSGSHSWLLGTLGTTLLRYMPEERSAAAIQRLTSILLTQLHGENTSIKLQCFRFLVRISREPEVLALCHRAVEGKQVAKGLKLGKRDRFLAAAAILASGAGPEALDKLVAAMGKEDIKKEAYIARAADPSANAKESYFASYLNLEEPPEQWVTLSLSGFHWRGQEEKTLPYLQMALRKVEWVKENRKIFFMPAWIDAFVNGHSSRGALKIVEDFLEEYQGLSLDIRRKILQSTDSLHRAVQIKERWK